MTELSNILTFKKLEELRENVFKFNISDKNVNSDFISNLLKNGVVIDNVVILWLHLMTDAENILNNIFLKVKTLLVLFNWLDYKKYLLIVR